MGTPQPCTAVMSGFDPRPLLRFLRPPSWRSLSFHVHIRSAPLCNFQPGWLGVDRQCWLIKVVAAARATHKQHPEAARTPSPRERPLFFHPSSASRAAPACAAFLFRYEAGLRLVRVTILSNVQYLLCRSCERPFALFAGTRKLTAEGMPDPFEATCPHCEGFALYPKSALKEMNVEQPRRERGASCP